MKNSYVRDLLEYYYGERCWLGGIVSKDNPLTLHHIKPVREGGKTTIDNGALLSLSMHIRFNILESHYPEYAEEINGYFVEYKGEYPDEVYFRIKELMALTEDKVYKNNNKNYRKVSNYSLTRRKRRRR